MKIALDARWIFEESSGIGQHTRMLIQSLARLEMSHRFLLIFDDAIRAEKILKETGCSWEHVVLPYGLFSLQNQFKLAAFLRNQKVDLYHSTNYMMPLWGFPRHREGQVKAIITIHDLIPMVYRDHAPKSRKSRLYPVYAWLMREVAARADRILTVSESSAKDVQERLGLAGKGPEKTRVVYNGLDPVFYEAHQVPRHDPPEILYVGRLDPYKNVPQLVSAFAEARRELPRGTRLRVIGPPDERYPEAMALARSLDLFPYMDWEGHVEFPTLVEAYRRASVLVLSSEYEGFGLPVAEAMACGTPVICSNASSLPEVAGDAARQVPPGDLFALKAALIEVLNDPEEMGRMVERGRVQAERFRMEKMAAGTLEVYESLGS
ncbi:glycosyltransferase family 1 protein [Kiritimatiellaeota bacterium B1221]|nr:glycosyltransferase family 1 protein [Kiritimatiellaeota bacterium B1221]